MSDEPIFHITSSDEWQAAQGQQAYTPRGFDEEGFIHCSYIHQLIQVANNFFRSQTDLVILRLDRSKLTCEVIEENLYGGTELFPHHYGPLAVDAVGQVRPFSCDENGGFAHLPDKGI